MLIMTRVSIVFGLLLAFVLTSAAAPSEALAQDGGAVALVPFRGRGARAVNRAFRRALRQRVTLADRRDTAEAAEDFEVSWDDRELVPDLAEELEASRVVVGRVRRRGRWTEIQAVVLDRGGRELRTERTRVRRARARDMNAFAEALFPEPPPAGGQAAAPAETVSPSSPPSTRDVFGDEPAAAGPRPADPNRPAVLTVDAGFSFRTRVGTIRLSDDTRLTHRMSFYPEVIGAVTVRPFVPGGDPGLAPMQFRVHTAYSLFFDASTDTDQVIGGSAWSLGGDFAYLFRVDSQVELGPVLGMTYEQYGIDETPLFATAEYLRVEARALVRFHIIPRLFILDAEGGWDHAFSGGPLATAFGNNFGGDAIYLEGVASGLFEVLDGFGLGWVLSLAWRRTSLSFGGEGTDPLAPAAGGIEEMVRVIVGLRVGAL